MAKEKFKLWFSEGQKRFYFKDDPNKKITFGMLEDGSIVEYTEATSLDSKSYWDDAKLLGIGNYHHSELPSC